MSRLIAVSFALMVLLFCAACGGEQALTDPNPTDDDSESLSCQTYTIPWLAQENFWTVAWSWIEIDVGWTASYGDFDANSYVMKLGPSTVVDGKTMYELQVSGDLDDFAPLWNYVGTDGCGNVYGQTSSSATPTLIYSETDGEWSGTGFWTDFSGFSPITVNRSASIVGSQYTGQLPYFEPPLTAVGFSESSSSYDPGGCEYFPGYGTICIEASVGPASGTQVYEYWDRNAGPVAMHYAYDFEDCLGVACNEKHVERRIEVWFFGDVSSVPLLFENEPDTYADPTPLPVSEDVLVMAGAIGEFDTPSGYLAGYNAEVGMDLAATIHDWFAFEITPELAALTVDFYLVWNDDVDLSFYLYIDPDNTQYPFTYLAESGDFPEFEDFNHARFFSGTYLPGKYMLGVVRNSGSTTETLYGIFSFAGTLSQPAEVAHSPAVETDATRRVFTRNRGHLPLQTPSLNAHFLRR